MTTFALIAIATSTLALVIVATGILALSIGNALKTFTAKSISTLSRKASIAYTQGNKSEAKMPSLATLYVS